MQHEQFFSDITLLFNEREKNIFAFHFINNKGNNKITELRTILQRES